MPTPIIANKATSTILAWQEQDTIVRLPAVSDINGAPIDLSAGWTHGFFVDKGKTNADHQTPVQLGGVSFSGTAGGVMTITIHTTDANSLAATGIPWCIRSSTDGFATAQTLGFGLMQVLDQLGVTA